MTRRRMANGDEVDAFSPWRKFLHWKPGERKAIKRKANRRERREGRDEIKEQMG